MKAYLYSGVLLAIIAGAWWLDHHGYKRAILERDVAIANYAKDQQVLLRNHDETKRKLASETRQKLAAVQALRVGDGDCYRLDDPLPDSARRLLDPRNR